jgi:hypothetical protein
MILNEIKNYRFPVWIAVFLCLLAAIPISIVFDLVVLAKVCGVLLVLSILFAMKYWFTVAKNRNNIVPRVVLNQNDLFDLSRDFNSFRAMNKEDQTVILNRIGLLLAQAKFVNQDHDLLERRESIQVSFLYITECWTDEFQVSSDWVFILSNTEADYSQYKFSISSLELSNKLSNAQSIMS